MPTEVAVSVAPMNSATEGEALGNRPLVVNGEKHSVNAAVLPLASVEGKQLGTLIMLEDISSEKRMKSTMARYIDPDLAEQMMAGGIDLLGGIETTATVLFSDIRGFTTLTEALGPQGTVALLNEYFTLMVDCIAAQGGMVDKYIGDAIMAAFGVPMEHDDDEDRAVRAGISMLTTLEGWNKQRMAKG
jgi:adenylate cyclase